MNIPITGGLKRCNESSSLPERLFTPLLDSSMIHSFVNGDHAPGKCCSLQRQDNIVILNERGEIFALIRDVGMLFREYEASTSEQMYRIHVKFWSANGCPHQRAPKRKKVVFMKGTIRTAKRQYGRPHSSSPRGV